MLNQLEKEKEGHKRVNERKVSSYYFIHQTVRALKGKVLLRQEKEGKQIA